MTTPDPIFLPSPEQARLLLDDLLDPDLSLRALAQRHNTSVAALSLFLASSRAADLLAPLHSGLATRIHLLSAENLPPAITALSRILSQFNHAQPDPTLTPEERTRARLHALRAAALLVRLSTHRPRPANIAAPAAVPARVAASAPLPDPAPPTPSVPLPRSTNASCLDASCLLPSETAPAGTPEPAPDATIAPDAPIAFVREQLRALFPNFSHEELEDIISETVASLPAQPELALAESG